MRDPSGLFVPGPEGALATGHGMPAVLEARGLGKRYRRRWALTDCTLAIRLVLFCIRWIRRLS